MNKEEEKLFHFLISIQLEQFHSKIVKELHVTRIEHFEHVFESDLLSLEMSMPEIRRLFENLKKLKKKSLFSKLRQSFRSSENINIVHYTPDVNIEINTDPKQVLQCLIQEKDIALKEMLGKGAFGYVQSAEWTTESKKKVSVAVKILQGNTDGLSTTQAEFVMEANAMSNLNHPNLIQLFGVVLTSPMMLVTELAPLGALLKRLRKEPEKFLISTLCSFVVQIAAGMKYLETNRFVHRDLAARNILLMNYEKIKIGDFGLARPVPENMHYYIMQPEGRVPFAWCAPECLKFRKFSHASDTWAFGVTVYELFTFGAEPWAGLNGAEANIKKN